MSFPMILFVGLFQRLGTPQCPGIIKFRTEKGDAILGLFHIDMPNSKRWHMNHELLERGVCQYQCTLEITSS